MTKGPNEEALRGMVRNALNRALGQAVAPSAPAPAAPPPASGPAAAAVAPSAAVQVATRTLTESDLINTPPGSTVRVPPGTLITPSAREWALFKRIVLLEHDGGPDIPPGSAVSYPPTGARAAAANRRVALGADHGGFEMKQQLRETLQSLGFAVEDCGPGSADAVDYPDFAYAVAARVASGACGWGIMIDGAGIGSCMVANKVPGVRAAHCYDVSTARNAREHNYANLLTLGAGLTGMGLAKQVVKTFLQTPVGGGRHGKRVDKIMAVERRFLRDG